MNPLPEPLDPRVASRILFVSADTGLARRLEQLFVGSGRAHGLKSARGAEEAERLVEDYLPDVVIVDEVLPEGTGLELVKRLLGAQVPAVVLLAGPGDDRLPVLALRAGAIDCIWKSPERLAQLPELVGEALRAHSLADLGRRSAESQRAALEGQLRRSQRMECAGTLAGGIAHEFNNILQTILGYTGMCLEETSPASPLHGDLEHVMTGAQRAKELVRQLLTFSRQVERERRPVHLKQIVEGALKLLRPSLPPTIAISSALEAQRDVVLADPTQIHQVLMNLCTNSYQAMRERGGTLELGLAELPEAEALALEPRLASGHDYARIRVRDDGPGMDNQVGERAFEPFFTTRRADEGTGLGLSVVHGIVMLHEGALALRSRPGEGTAVDVYLPLVPEAAPAPALGPGPPLSGGRVLYVEDDVQNATLARHMLERLGFEVRVERDAPVALELFRSDPDGFDLVVTDQSMPLLTGTQLAREMHALRPALPILLVTGFLGEDRGELDGGDGPSGFLTKPFLPQDLALAIERVRGCGLR